MNEAGYWFALPRLLARMSGRKVRRAEWSPVEAYGLGWLVFLLPCVFLWRERGWFLVLTPIAVWLGWLLLYFLVWLLANALRRLGLFHARTNNPLQSVFVLGVASLCAFYLLTDASLLPNSLGIFWFTLVALNVIAALLLRLTHEG